MKIDWKRKLTSRKFWLAVAAFIVGLVLAFKGQDEVSITGCVMSFGSVVAYIIGEGLTDAKGGSNDKDGNSNNDNN